MRCSSACVDGSIAGAAAFTSASSSCVRASEPFFVASSAAASRSSSRATAPVPIRPACCSRRASRSGVICSSSGTAPSVCTMSRSRAWASRSRTKPSASRPDCVSRAAASSAPRESPAAIASKASKSRSASATPSTARTSSVAIRSEAEPLPCGIHPGVRDELLQGAEGVAEGAGGVAREQHDRVGRDVDLLARRDALDDGGELLDRRPREVEAVAAVDDRRQDLRGLGRGEHEDGVRRRLLERLEKRVPCLGGEHVRLVEDVDLVAPGDRRVDDALAQVADVVDGVVGGGVHLDDVQRVRRGDRDARVAHAAGLDGRPLLAVQAGGEDLRHRGLAGAARADEEVRVVDLVLRDGVAQRAHDVVLTDDVGERPRAMATVERGGLGHGRSRIASNPRPAHPRRRPRARAGADTVSRMARIRFVAGVLVGAAALRLLAGPGLVNYDTLYTLVWGRQLGHGTLPDLEVAIAPTPHPLADLGALALSPLSSLQAGGLSRGARRHGRHRARLRLARAARVGRLRARARVVQPGRGRARGGHRPHPRPGARLRRPCLHRHPVPRARARRAARRDARAALRRPGARPARAGRPAAPRGVAVLGRLPRCGCCGRGCAPACAAPARAARSPGATPPRSSRSPPARPRCGPCTTSC